ncbi:MAG: TetR/AcrR family transcriptional regulator [Bermanella sp.]
MNLKHKSILNAATTLFSKYGFHAVGIDRIIADSNVAKMTFYKYYPSKELLIESVLIKYDEDFRNSINIAIVRHQTERQKIKAIFDWHEERFVAEVFYGCLFTRAVQEFPDTAAKVHEISQDHKTWLASVISYCLEQCQVESYAETSVYILVILDGLSMRSNMFKGDPKELVASAWRHVEAMIKAEPEDFLA